MGNMGKSPAIVARTLQVSKGTARKYMVQAGITPTHAPRRKYGPTHTVPNGKYSKRNCLSCDIEFDSWGDENRKCPLCRERDKMFFDAPVYMCIQYNHVTGAE
jgi:hypothetical protein